MKRIILYLFVFLSLNTLAQDYSLKGIVSQKDTIDILPGANVLILETNQATFSDKEGRFSFYVNEGEYTIIASFMGFSTFIQKLSIHSNTNLNILLLPNEQEIKEVIISNRRNQQNIENPQTGMVKLSMQDMKRLPVFLGENDPIKAIRLTPGVQAGGEGNEGIFVRGGNPGQNLILLEDMPIYNASHLIGLFSVFNPGILKNLTLYKGTYPVAYGGRASSMMKIGLNDGIPEKIEMEGSIGFISSRLSVKMPLFKGNASLLLGGRITYLEVYQPFFRLLQLNNVNLQNNKFGFNDLNARFELKLSTKNRIIVNSYSGIDNYSLIKSSIGMTNSMNWGNRAGTLKWIHLFNEQCSWTNTVGITSYFFNLKASYQKYAIKLLSKIVDPFFHSEVLISHSNHLVSMGFETTLHKIIPESVDVKIDESNYNSNLSFRAGEISFFVGDTYNLNSKISLVAGVRATSYLQLGTYDRFISNAQGNIIDTINFGNNKVVKPYNVIEPRISVNFKQSEKSSYKVSLSRNYQFLHLISVGTVSLPTDIWFPSTLLVKPEYSDQITLGYFRNINNNRYESSFELYFKQLNNIIEFKKSLITQFKYNEFEESITHGMGYSFGAEWYIKKNSGDFTGWLSYTLSWSIRKFKEINDGEFFFGKYDRRHDLAITLQYQLSKRWSLSSVFIYSTGNAMTLPGGRYMIQGNIVNDYTSVNSFRMPTYQRLDLSATYTRKIRSEYESSWNFSLYNAYNRANPFYVYFEAEGNLDEYYLSVKAKKVSLFPMLPSVSWQFKF